MLNRRRFLGGLSAGLPLLAMPGSLLAQGASASLHVIVVGINTYTGLGGDGRPIRSLRGCQNDAADIWEQVQKYQPATKIRLGWDIAAGREKAVTRREFLQTWEDVLGAARRGDRLLLTFAGHGSRIPVLPGNPSGETDGYDETLVLTGYSASQGRGGEHIIDDELNAMFRAADAKGVVTIFIADSCHSGTLTRSVDGLAGDRTYRYVPPPPLPPGRDAPLGKDAPPVSSPPDVRAPRLENLVFIAGSQEDETVPEITDPRTRLPRGALSIAVARALEGEGDAATDGIITDRSLTTFVRRYVRLLGQGVQNADVVWPTMVTESGVARDLQLFVLPGKPSPTPTIRPVRLAIHGRSPADAQRLIAALRNAVLADPGGGETLAWHAGPRLVLNDQGHRIADEVGEGDLQHVVDCRLALDRLIEMTANGLEVKVLLNGQETRAADGTLKAGDKVVVKIRGFSEGAYLAVFNFTGKGVVQLLDPTPYHDSNPNRADYKRPHFNTGWPSSGGERSLPEVRVGEPFGADHVIAVAGAQPLTRLMAGLVAANERQDVQGVMAALASERAAQPLKLGLRGVFTWRT
jgi:hypothetical protein